MQCPKKQPIKLQGNNKLEKKKYIYQGSHEMTGQALT